MWPETTYIPLLDEKHVVLNQKEVMNKTAQTKVLILNSSEKATGGVVKHFSNLTGKHLCWSSFLIELQAWGPANLLKRDSNTGILLWNLQNF